MWTCNAITTTTTVFTTTTALTTTTAIPTPVTTSTLAPSPVTIKPFPFPTFDHPAYLYLSLACNILQTFGLLMVAYFKCKKRILRFVQNRRNRAERNRVATAGTGIVNSAFVNPANPINPRTGRSCFSVSGSTDEEYEPLLTSSSQTLAPDQRTQAQAIADRADNFFESIDLASPRGASFLNTPPPAASNAPNSMRSLNPNYMLMKTFKRADAATQTFDEKETVL